MNQKQIKILGWAASVMSVIMYVSYIAQIIANLQGHKGSWVQPLAATVNCLLWSIYALTSAPKQWPVAAANLPGIFLALGALVTSL